MKVLLFLAALTSLVFVSQITAQDTAKVEVVKFNWSMFDQSKLTTESGLPAEEFAVRTVRNNQIREKTIDEQSYDLRKMESAARRTSSAPPGKIFLYELKVKNLDGKTIKSFVWEYQIAKNSASPNASNRRFLCSEKIKAGDSKTLKIISHLPPANVVDASAKGNESKKDLAVEIIINRVEYTDGTIWKRAGWDDSKYRLVSPNNDEKLKFNDCAAL
jgi:hypothetical protein